MNSDPDEFYGRVAIITGAAEGMGCAYVRDLSGRGVKIMLQDINRAGVERLAAEIGEAGGTACPFAFDIADPSRSKAMVDAVLKSFGRIDILVNNAGIGDDRRLEDIDEAAFDRMFGVHVKGTFFMSKAVVPAMKTAGRGAIVNVSSRWAMAGHDLASDYVAAKSAVLGFTKAWAKELAPFGITVNAIAPGGVWSRMVLDNLGEAEVRRQERLVPLGRWAQPEEIAPLVAFLTGDRGRFLTGQVIGPNGGKTLVGF